MKHLIFVLLLVACSQEKADPNFASLAGDWKISGEVTGRFTVVEIDGQFVVDHGAYKYDGTEYQIKTKQAIETEPNFKIKILLVSDAGSVCVFRDCDYDTESFKTITPSKTDCYIGGAFSESYYNVTVTR